MIKSLLSPSVQSFIEDHYSDDPAQLLLRHKTIFDIPVSIIVDQIIGRKKAADKIPSWYNEKKIVYPRALHIEQASSEKAALTKIDLLQKELEGEMKDKVLVDLTGGLGVDSFFFSNVFKSICFVEPDSRLVEIAKHNHFVLGATNIIYFNSSADDFLKLPGANHADIIYIDPSRRKKGNQKVFSLNQCEPDVVHLQQRIWRISHNLLVKASPLLDIQQALTELEYVKHVSIISIRGDCKELLLFCKKLFKTEPVITALHLNDERFTFSFFRSDERKADVEYHDPLQFLYEPNASLLKGGCFKLIGSNFKLFKLHPNTHLYTSENLRHDFPGRIFQIDALLKFNQKEIRHAFQDGKANILTRNYPVSVDEIRKKARLKEGGLKFLVACTGLQEKFLLKCTRIK